MGFLTTTPHAKNVKQAARTPLPPTCNAASAYGLSDFDGDRWTAWLEPQVHEARVVVVHRHLSLWAALGVKTIGDMGTWKYAAAAHAIATLAACEASDASQHK